MNLALWKMRRLLSLFAILGTLGLATGCGTRAVVIDPRVDIVRLGPDVRGSVYVYQGGMWVLTSKTKLPEGWYAGPGPSPDKK